MSHDFDRIDPATVEEMHARLTSQLRPSPVAPDEQLPGPGVVLLKQEFRRPESWVFRAVLAKARELIESLPPAPLEGVELVVAAGGDLGRAAARVATVLGCRARVFLSGWDALAPREVKFLGGQVVDTFGFRGGCANAARRYFDTEQGRSHLIVIDRRTAVIAAATIAREFEAQAGSSCSDHPFFGVGRKWTSPLDRVFVSATDPVLVAGAVSWFGDRADVVSVACEGDRAAGSAGRAKTLVVSHKDEQRARGWFRDRYGIGDPRAALPVSALLSGRCRREPGERLGFVLDPPKNDHMLGFTH